MGHTYMPKNCSAIWSKIPVKMEELTMKIYCFGGLKIVQFAPISYL